VKLNTYLNYGGNCRQAFEFYAKHLGGKITMLMTHGESPERDEVPDDWKDAVLHARIVLGGTALLAADVPPDRFQPMRSAYLSLTLDSAEEAERVYALLADGGQIFMPMEETFFALRFAMLRDRFGTSWMLMYEREREQPAAGAPRHQAEGRTKMATAKQKTAARKNIKKAAKAAKSKKTISKLPKKTRTALGKQGAEMAKRKGR
jgi:PhnB protein